jgi:hypothetical protein
MTVLMLSGPVLLMGMRTRDLMSDTNLTKVGIDFVIEHALNKSLKFKKILIDLRFVTE